MDGVELMCLLPKPESFGPEEGPQLGLQFRNLNHPHDTEIIWVELPYKEFTQGKNARKRVSDIIGDMFSDLELGGSVHMRKARERVWVKLGEAISRSRDHIPPSHAADHNAAYLYEQEKRFWKPRLNALLPQIFAAHAKFLARIEKLGERRQNWQQGALVPRPAAPLHPQSVADGEVRSL